MKKRKTIKKITFSALALVMATAGILAFAPMDASATEPTTTTTGLGLDPKNDPIVYTTESGLEIRMSNANKFSGTLTTTSNKGATSIQDISTFYYLTMGKFSGTVYTAKTQTDSYTVSNHSINWIILGVGSHSTAFIDSVSNYLFSTLKNNDYLFSNGEYFFQNQHETFSPAGELINSVINTKTYIMGKVKDSIPVHTDIPKGCMLVLSEKMLGNMYFNSSGSLNYGFYTDYADYNLVYGQTNLGNRYRYIGNVSTSTAGAQTWTISGNAGGSLYNHLNTLFSKNASGTILSNSLGFTNAQANLVVPQQLYTYYSNGTGYDYAETPSTDGGTYYTMFPLAYRGAHSTIKQNFCIEDYLTTDSQRVATFINSNNLSHSYWLRSGIASAQRGIYAVFPSGAVLTNAGADDAKGVRPAMVMKLS